jgi:hypothetical protein
VVEFLWAGRQCHIVDSDTVGDIHVDLVLAAIGGLDDSIVGSIVSSIVGFPIVGSIVGFAIIRLTVDFAIIGLIVGCSIIGLIVGFAIIGSFVGSVISTLERSLFLFFPFSVVDKIAVARTMIYMPFNSLPARGQEDGEVI